jgi:tetratricopeptide (TPR) repeat protein
MKALLTHLCCCSLLAISGQVVAAEAHSARADALFLQGQALLDAGKLEAACSKFEASEAAENGLGTLLHLGDCYERLGRSASAWHAFLEAEAVAHAQKDVEREQVAAERVAALEPKLSRVVFVVPSTSRVPGLTVQLGDNTIPTASFGTIIPVDAGVQRINASAKGHRAWHLDVTVTRGDAREYRVNVPTLMPVPVPEPIADRRGAFRTAGIVTGGVGVAGLGAGAVFSALARNADDANTCARGVIQCTPGRSSKSGYGDAATVSFAVGGALVATGVTLFVLAPAPDNQERHALRVAARVAPGVGRLQLEGAW